MSSTLIKKTETPSSSSFAGKSGIPAISLFTKKGETPANDSFTRKTEMPANSSFTEKNGKSANPSFTRQLQAERQKGRRRYLMLVPLGFLLFQLLWTIWQLQRADSEELETGYLLLFHHLPMINTLLLPMMAAVIASRLCDMEIKGDTLKLLYTMQKQTGLFNCKYLTGLKYLAAFTLGQGLLILGAGMLYHFAGPLKWLMLIEHLAVTFSVSAVLLALQQMLSLLSASQLLPLAAGLVGCFLGLFSLFFPTPVARLFIWGYYAAFPVSAMDWERDTRIVRYFEVPFSATGFLIFLAAAVIIYLLCQAITIRKEV